MSGSNRGGVKPKRRTGFVPKSGPNAGKPKGDKKKKKAFAYSQQTATPRPADGE